MWKYGQVIKTIKTKNQKDKKYFNEKVTWSTNTEKTDTSILYSTGMKTSIYNRGCGHPGLGWRFTTSDHDEDEVEASCPILFVTPISATESLLNPGHVMACVSSEGPTYGLWYALPEILQANHEFNIFTLQQLLDSGYAVTGSVVVHEVESWTHST